MPKQVRHDSMLDGLVFWSGELLAELDEDSSVGEGFLNSFAILVLALRMTINLRVILRASIRLSNLLNNLSPTEADSGKGAASRSDPARPTKRNRTDVTATKQTNAYAEQDGESCEASDFKTAER